MHRWSTCSPTWIFNSLNMLCKAPLSVTTRNLYPYPVRVMSMDKTLVRHTPCSLWQARKAPVDACLLRSYATHSMNAKQDKGSKSV
jgi:hypothetical protein